MKTVSLVTLAVGLLVAADRPWKDDAAKEELARLQGTWQLISAEADGVKAPEDRIKPVRVTIAGNTHTVRFGDRVIAHDVTFEIDPTATPKATTDTIGEGPDKGKRIRGIYRLDGDTLTSCVAGVDQERPTEFASKPGSGHTLRVFRRVQATEKGKAMAIQEELKRFEGTWHYEMTIVEGTKLPDDALDDTRLIVKGDHFEMVDPRVTHRGTFTVDPTARPKTIDVAFTEGPNAGKTSRGIYELEGDVYKVCVGMAGLERPNAFDSKPGNGLALQTLRRVRPRP